MYIRPRRTSTATFGDPTLFFKLFGHIYQKPYESKALNFCLIRQSAFPTDFGERPTTRAICAEESPEK
jgi:hypothetical protein